MKIYNGHHYLTISRGIQLLKMCDFKPALMDRKYDTVYYKKGSIDWNSSFQETINRCPCPENVVRWTHTVVCEWLRHIDLAEFTPNMLCAGVPGCLLVGINSNEFFNYEHFRCTNQHSQPKVWQRFCKSPHTRLFFVAI